MRPIWKRSKVNSKISGKIVKSLHHCVLSQWKCFWVYIYALCIGLRSQMLYPNRRIEICQVRMFVKQRRTHGWSSYLPGKNIFIPQQKSSNLYIIMFEVKRFWVCIYAHCSSIRSQMLYTRGSFEFCQERLFVKQRRTHRWSSYLLVALTELRKNIIIHIIPRKTRKVLISHEILFAQKNNAKFYLHVAWACSNCQLLDAEM